MFSSTSQWPLPSVRSTISQLFPHLFRARFKLLSCTDGSYVYTDALSLFIPIIIASLGTWTRSQSVLLSTPPFFLAFFITLTSAYYSDRIAQRGLFNIFWMSIALIGFIILLAVEPSRAPGVCYFALFLTVGGISPCISNSISWTGGNNGPVYKRATAMGLFFTFGNSGGIIASTVYMYVVILSFSLGFCWSASRGVTCWTD